MWNDAFHRGRQVKGVVWSVAAGGALWLGSGGAAECKEEANVNRSHAEL